MACTRYTERPNLRCWLPAPSSQLPAPGSQHPAPSSQHSAPLSLSAAFDTTLAGTQQVHPCMLKCAILSAQGLYALYRKAELALLASCSQLSAPGSRLPAPSSRLPAPSSQLPALGSQLPAPSPQFSKQ